MSERDPPQKNAALTELYKLGIFLSPALIFIFWTNELAVLFRWFVLLPVPILWYVSYWISYSFYCIAIAFDTAILSTGGGWSREQTARWLIDASHDFYCGFPRSSNDEFPGCPPSSPGRVVLYAGMGVFMLGFCYFYFRIARELYLTKKNNKAKTK